MSVPPPSAPPLRVALIGNPNTGKSTLFSSLAGVHSRIGNYPGVTVEKKVGRVDWEQRQVELIDLPGTYSLAPRTRDEMVSVDVLLGEQDGTDRPDVVVCIVDAANLNRNLYLFSQLLDVGLPIVLVLNMWDVARSRGITIDVESLQKRLGVPVVTTSAHRREGLDELRATILAQSTSDPPSPPRIFPDVFHAETRRLAEQLATSKKLATPPYLLERLLLDVGGYVEDRMAGRRADLADVVAAARQRLDEQECRVPAIEARVRYGWIRKQLDGVVQQPKQRPVTASDRLDRILTHRVGGLLVFIVLMLVVFQSLYSWAAPLMDSIEWLQGLVAGGIESVLGPGALRSLLVDGVVAGVGGVLVFLPQIVLLFLFIAILEDCGYMARAAFLMDRLMTKVGLSGKSFVPLMSSFACAIPGIMATRVIENPRDRLVTILVAPLMSCSARLPVYILLIGAFVPATTYLGGWLSLRGLVLLGMMSVGAGVAVPVAWLLKKTIFRGETPPFVMELPSYKWPSPGIVVRRVYDRAKAFVTRAGSLIFATTLVVWAAGYFPGDHTELNQVQTELESLDEKDESTAARRETLVARHHELSAELMATSLLGRAGKLIEPAVKPLGWDWRIGVGAIASFPAREVIIATLGTIYSLGGDVDEEDEGLMGTLKQAKWPDGRPVYNLPVALSIMVFFALCAQCGATLMVIQRETNSWLWPLVTFGYMTGLAYLGAFVTYQVGRMWL